MNRRDNPDCHKCRSSRGDFLLILWSCDKIRSFWLRITQFIATHFDLPNVCNPKWCILGVLEDVDLGSYQKQFLSYFLSYARKFVILQWINSEVVSLNLWKNLINQVLPIYKLTYEAYEFPYKFDKIWGQWVAFFDTCELPDPRSVSLPFMDVIEQLTT